MNFKIELEIANDIVKQIEKSDEVVVFEDLLEWLLFDSEEGLYSRNLKGKMRAEYFRMIKGKYESMTGNKNYR